MNYDAITLQDCIAMYEILHQETVIMDGHIAGFIKEGSQGE